MRFAVLASGQGTNLQALLDAEARGELTPAAIAVVLTNRDHAGALTRARAAGKPTCVVPHGDYASRGDFEGAMLEALAPHKVDGVVLAGFMRVLTARFLDAFPERVVNTHPSLLPAFPGMHAAQQALDHGVKVAGCTLHLVETGVDTGPIIAQSSVPVHDGDTADTLQKRIQAEEHRLLPHVVRRMAGETMTVTGRLVTFG